jgi:hypothetical protein
MFLVATVVGATAVLLIGLTLFLIAIGKIDV